MKAISFNSGWTCRHLEEEGPGMPVSIPHDAMLAEPKSETAPGGTNTGWYEGFDYLYQKSFLPGRELQDKRLVLEFEGVYHNAEVWLNGEKITSDLFTAPVSNYSKTLWYNTYDVTNLLNKGENILAVICGCGWYNEGIESAWDYDKAKWRDNPKFIMQLDVYGNTIVKIDNSWKCNINAPITYNQLRCGEHFDSRLYNENWTKQNFDDSEWERTIVDSTPPTGAFRHCECEPIRECGVFPAKAMYQTGNNKYVWRIVK